MKVISLSYSISTRLARGESTTNDRRRAAMTQTATQIRPTDIGTHARKVLKKLTQGKTLAADGAIYRAGNMVVSATLVDVLHRADLIAPKAKGVFELTLPGQRVVDRQAAPADPYGAQNRLLAKAERKIEGVRQKVTVNLADNPLAWLARRNLLTAAQLEAGDRLRSDFHQSQSAARVTMNWGAPPLGGAKRGAPDGLDPTQAQIAAKRRLERAIDAVGSGLSDVLSRVVCAGEGLESAERALQWPPRTAKLVLGLALDRLVVHYGMRV
jgi:hypothetical protein